MADERKAHLKEVAGEEIRLLLLISAYLAAFFVAFLTYRRLISREFGVSSFRYGYAILEAVVIAKVILIGKAMGVGKGSRRRSLALSALRSSFAYGALVAAFAVLEHVVEGLLHGKTLRVSVEDFLNQGVYEILGRTLIMFVAFIPFFALWELSSQTGGKNPFDVFFRKV